MRILSPFRQPIFNAHFNFVFLSQSVQVNTGIGQERCLAPAMPVECCFIIIAIPLSHTQFCPFSAIPWIRCADHERVIYMQIENSCQHARSGRWSRGNNKNSSFLATVNWISDLDCWPFGLSVNFNCPLCKLIPSLIENTQGLAKDELDRISFSFQQKKRFQALASAVSNLLQSRACPYSLCGQVYCAWIHLVVHPRGRSWWPMPVTMA